MSSQTDAAMYDAKTILIPLAPLMGNPVGAAAALVTLRTLLESFGAISKVAEASSGDVLMVIYEDEKGADLARQAIYASAYGANYYGMAHGQDITNETQETMTPEVPSLSAAKAELDELAALKETFMCPTTATLGVASEHSNSADSDTVSDGTESSRETPTAAKLCSIQSFARSEVRWDLLANDKETRTVLQLRGLPRAMSQPGKFEALLTSKGLSELTKKVRVQPCKGSARFCTALVQAKDCEAVKKITKFFHGKQFTGSTLPVSVSFAQDQDTSSGTKKELMLAALKKPLPAPCRLVTPPGVEKICPPPGLERQPLYV